MPALLSISAKRSRVVVLHGQRHLSPRILEFKNGKISIKTGGRNKILIFGGIFEMKMYSDFPKTSPWLSGTEGGLKCLLLLKDMIHDEGI